MEASGAYPGPEYRPCVGIMLINRAGLVFIGKRRGGRRDAEARGYEWQMPQGGVDKGENLRAAAERELYEETSIRSVELLREAPDWLWYDLPPAASGAFKGKFRGQAQKWFAFRFTGGDSEIDVRHPGGGGHKAEFSDWRWEAIGNLAALVIPFKRPVYEAAVKLFKPLAG